MTKAMLEKQVKELQERISNLANERNDLCNKLYKAGTLIDELKEENKKLNVYVDASKKLLQVLMRDVIEEEIKNNLQLKEGDYNDYYSNGSVIELYYKEQNLGQVSITTKRWSED